MKRIGFSLPYDYQLIINWIVFTSERWILRDKPEDLGVRN